MLEELRSKPEEWRLFPELMNRPASLLRRVRRRRVRALRVPDGVIQVRAGWIGTTVEGKAIADIYLRFVPSKEEP